MLNQVFSYKRSHTIKVFSNFVTKIEQIRQYNHTRLFVLVCYTRSSAVIQTNLTVIPPNSNIFSDWTRMCYLLWVKTNQLPKVKKTHEFP